MDHAQYWQRRGASLADGRVLRLADEAPGAALPEAALVPLLGVDALRVRGADRLPFLHGQLSHDVQGLPQDGCRRMLQLNVRGQVVAEALLCRRADDVFVAVEDGAGEALRASLEAHVVFDEVTIEPLAGVLAALTLQGPRAVAVAESVLGAVPEAGRALEHGWGEGRVLVTRRRRGPAGGVDLHLLAGEVASLVGALEQAGACAVGEEALALARIRAGLPAAAREAGGGVLPQEAGLEPLVSYRKGCYLGQEIMARIEARGRLHRSLARVRFAGDAAVARRLERSQDRELRVGGRAVGRLGSVAWGAAEGVVALAVVRTGSPDGALPEVDGVRVTELAFLDAAAA